jgi:hypothetical protein
MNFKHIFIGNSDAWLRLLAAVAALAIASALAKPVAPSHSGKILLASLPKPGSMREW